MEVGGHRRLLAVTSGCVVGGVVATALAAFAYRDVDCGYEGPSLWLALRIAHGLPIYGREAAFQPPHAFATYGPLFYSAYGVAFRLLGAGSFLAGRLLSLLCSLATAALIFRWVASQGRSPLAGLAAVALFLAAPAGGAWVATARPDPPGTLCCALALFLAGRRPAAAGAAAAAAFLFKPLLVGAGLALWGQRLIARDWPGLLRLTLGALLVVAGVLVLLALTGNLGYLWNLRQMSRMAWEPGTGGLILLLALLRPSTWLGVVLAVLSFRREPRAITSIYLIASLPCILSSFHRGAAPNHYAEISLALALAGGTELGLRMAEGGAGQLRVLRASGAAMLLSAALFSTLQAAVPWTSLPESRVRLLEMARALQTVPPEAPIASELGPLVTGRHPVWFDELYNFNDPGTAPHRIWEEAVSRREVKALALSGPCTVAGYHPAGPSPELGRPTLYLPDPD